MRSEASQTHATFKASDGQFVSSSRDKTRKRNGQGVPVKQRDGEQGQCKQDEIEWNTEEEDWLGQLGLYAFGWNAKFLI